MAEATSALEQLRSFSQAIIHFIAPETPTPEDFTYSNWEQALRQVAKEVAETGADLTGEPDQPSVASMVELSPTLARRMRFISLRS